MQNDLSNPQAANSNLTAFAIRESVFAGIIAFALFFFFIGLETTQNIRNELVIVQHWVKLAVVVILVMAIRFLMITVIWPYLAKQKGARDRGRSRALRWAFEELRVAIFAPELKPALSVSVASLTQSVAALR